MLHTMKGLFIGYVWAQSFAVQVFLEGGKAYSPIQARVLGAGGEVLELSGTLSEGKAVFSLPRPVEGVVCIYVPGYLPVRTRGAVSLRPGVVLDLAHSQNLHPQSGFVEKEGKVFLAAGELGSLPSEKHPVINAYDYELFLLAQKSQDLQADYNGDRRVDEKDLDFLLKNQTLLLRTEL
jgi:hypothetical protein